MFEVKQLLHVLIVRVITINHGLHKMTKFAYYYLVLNPLQAGHGCIEANSQLCIHNWFQESSGSDRVSIAFSISHLCRLLS